MNMTTDTLREAVRTGRPFKITTADGRTVEIPHPEFAMISGSGRIFYVAKPDSDLFEAFDVLLITGVEQEGKLPTHKLVAHSKRWLDTQLQQVVRWSRVIVDPPSSRSRGTRA